MNNYKQRPLKVEKEAIFEEHKEEHEVQVYDDSENTDENIQLHRSDQPIFEP